MYEFIDELKIYCVAVGVVRKSKISLECTKAREPVIRQLLQAENYTVEDRHITAAGNIRIRAV